MNVHEMCERDRGMNYKMQVYHTRFIGFVSFNVVLRRHRPWEIQCSRSDVFILESLDLNSTQNKESPHQHAVDQFNF